MSSKKTDPVEIITLHVNAPDVPFAVTWDDARLFRFFETTALKLPGIRQDKLPAEAFESRNVVFPPAAAIAREAVIHFKKTFPLGLQGEFNRLADAAFKTGKKAIEDLGQQRPVGDIHLPADAIMEPAEVMALPEMKDARTIILDAAENNARALHPKAKGRPSSTRVVTLRYEERIRAGRTRAEAIADVAEALGMETDTVLEHVSGSRETKRRRQRANKRKRSRR